jgi:hypothetical protein
VIHGVLLAEAVAEVLTAVLSCPREFQSKVNAGLYRIVVTSLLKTARMDFHILKVHDVSLALSAL